jgi:hypothetical protein
MKSLSLYAGKHSSRGNTYLHTLWAFSSFHTQIPDSHQNQYSSLPYSNRSFSFSQVQVAMCSLHTSNLALEFKVLFSQLSDLLLQPLASYFG